MIKVRAINIYMQEERDRLGEIDKAIHVQVLVHTYVYTLGGVIPLLRTCNCMYIHSCRQKYAVAVVLPVLAIQREKSKYPTTLKTILPWMESQNDR